MHWAWYLANFVKHHADPGSTPQEHLVVPFRGMSDGIP